jgi:putative transposase
MSRYRRSDIPGGTYFFTVVTYRRRNILIEPESRTILREVINSVKQRHPFIINAWVLLPDHLHSIWTLPPGDHNYSKRWGLIKAGFSKQAKNLFHREEWMNESKTRRKESTIWQRRYWEHQIRNSEDYQRHMDYLHFNPVKHGLVKRVIDWPYPTFHRHVKNGVYPEDWCGMTDADVGEFGDR